MTTSEAIKHFDGVQKLADALRVRRQSIWKWKRKGRIPMGRQFQLQAMTKGALKVDDDLQVSAAA